MKGRLHEVRPLPYGAPYLPVYIVEGCMAVVVRVQPTQCISCHIHNDLLLSATIFCLLCGQAHWMQEKDVSPTQDTDTHHCPAT